MPATKATHTSIRIFLNPPHESATFLIRSPEWKFLNTVWIWNRVGAKSGYIYIYIFIRWRNKIEPVLYREYCIQDGNLVPRFAQGRAKFRALYDACSVANIPSGVPGTRVNLDTCARANSIWIRTLVDVEIFESGKKKLRILLYPDTYGWGLNSHTNYFCEN